tara:strand:+ start:4145 stop:4519 length:375 start_codon:yes stop_codon:yes gene_type:complete
MAYQKKNKNPNPKSIRPNSEKRLTETTASAFVDSEIQKTKTSARKVKRAAGQAAEKGLSGLIESGKVTKQVLEGASKATGITRPQKKVDRRTTKLIKEKYGKPASKAEINKARAARRANGDYGK